MRKHEETRDILKSISKNEHKLYHVNFKTREYSVEESSLQSSKIKLPIKDFFNHENYRRSSENLTEKLEEKNDNNWFVAMMLIIMMASFFAIDSHARNPQGEYSSLLENNKKRSDFKNEKDMLNYIKKEDRKITKKLNNQLKK